jgi:F-type H+-transporting ATPase subunit f
MDAVVGFYKALPKGEAPAKRGGGIKARFFDGKNASSKPIVAYIAFMLLFGYTIDVSSARAGVECGAGLTYHTDSTTCT